MASIDPQALAQQTIKGLSLNRALITGEGDKLRFSPGTYGDAAHITSVVKKLSLSDQQAITEAACVDNYADPARTTAAYRALHVDRDHISLRDQLHYAAAAGLALLIARELGVEVK